MKQMLKNLSASFAFAGLLLPNSLLAQQDDKEVKEKKAVEEVVIIRKGKKAKNEKTVVEIVDDKITINGKPIEEYKGDDVKVRRQKLSRDFSFDALNGLGDANSRTFMFQDIDTNTAFLGVTTDKIADGALIQEVSKGSAAEKAGLKKGDIIKMVDNAKIENPDNLTNAIREHKPGDKVKLSILRDDKEKIIAAELGKWKPEKILRSLAFSPHGNFKEGGKGKIYQDEIMEDVWSQLPKAQSMPRMPRAPRVYAPNGEGWNWSENEGPRMGLSIQDTEDGKGVKVLEADDDGNAAKSGVKNDDIITEVDGKAVNSADELAKEIKGAKDKKSIMLKLLRNGKTQNIEVKIPRKLKTLDL